MSTVYGVNRFFAAFSAAGVSPSYGQSQAEKKLGRDVVVDVGAESAGDIAYRGGAQSTARKGNTVISPKWRPRTLKAGRTSKDFFSPGHGILVYSGILGRAFLSLETPLYTRLLDWDNEKSGESEEK